MTKQRKKIGIGPEGTMHKNFARLVRQYEAYNRLKDCAAWTYNAAGEKRSIMTGALLKAKGLAKGWPDYLFIKSVAKKKQFIAEFIWIEFKAPNGKQSDEQFDFEVTCQHMQNMRYYLAYSVEQAIKILEKEGFLK